MEELVIHCIRHGQSVANAGGVSSDAASIPLTELGHAQARAVSARLAATAPDLVICSPFSRARQTAEPTLALLPDVPVETWPIEEFTLLAERWGGSTMEDRKPWVREYWQKADPDYVDGEGAESFAAFIGRIRTTMEKLETLPSEKTILAFGHCQFFLALRWLITQGIDDITPDAMQAFYAYYKHDPIPNASGFTASFDGRAWRIKTPSVLASQPYPTPAF
ncbi:MAG TPA: histidine phosphatase family protein [Rhodospirillaceae bacterium]|nr:MAG: hypothetical protein A2018_08230 [Alphaproteobacteria bacterium GWF2_58_20]HAU29941.1 histidine phosphatase family protein [Rhodospirillaceae bacterium]